MLKTSAKARAVGVGIAALLGLAACGGGGGGGDDDGVASLSQPSTADTGDGGDGSSDEPPSEAEMQQAALDFAACMREHGVDMPDPEFGDGGEVAIQVGGGEGEQIDQETMDAANEACQSIMEDVSGGFEPDPEQEAEMKEEALAHAQCMRDHGIENYPDPVFQDGGGVMVAIGEDSGFDPSSAEFQEAQEACQEEFGGPGGGPAGGKLNTNEDQP